MELTVIGKLPLFATISKWNAELVGILKSKYLTH